MTTSQTSFGRRSRALGAALILLAASVCAVAQEAEKGKSADARPQGGILFKPPKGFMPLDFAGFKGVLMINPKRAAGMFIAYPDDGETLDALRERARDAAGRMFIHDKGKAKAAPLAWKAATLPPHPEDGEGGATLFTYAEGETQVQVATYARADATHRLVYGYFAMRHTPKGRDDDGKFLDEQGGGVKEFADFRKSLGGKGKD
ncbi:MAG TPA: hypothetical protein VER32_05460 [Pyrinomonadaceae bacterium]|nr:hypothetical protein [Pyrinomonadaceae bacterium]